MHLSVTWTGGCAPWAAHCTMLCSSSVSPGARIRSKACRVACCLRTGKFVALRHLAVGSRRSRMALPPEACASAIESWLPAGKWNRFKPHDGVLDRLERLTASQRPRSSILSSSELTPRRQAEKTGGVALLLRGHVDRGHDALSWRRVSTSQRMSTRHLLQQHCSQSVMRELVAPLVARSVAVGVHLTVFDDVAEQRLQQIVTPYAEHVASVTRIASANSSQLTTIVAALRALLRVTQASGLRYDSVVMTRFDLLWKAQRNPDREAPAMPRAHTCHVRFCCCGGRRARTRSCGSIGRSTASSGCGRAAHTSSRMACWLSCDAVAHRWMSLQVGNRLRLARRRRAAAAGCCVVPLEPPAARHDARDGV